MASTRPARLLRSATKARHNSIANTAASSANLPCGTFERFFLQVLRNSNWSVASESASLPLLSIAQRDPGAASALTYLPRRAADLQDLDSGLKIEHDPCWRMVARVFLPTRPPVNTAVHQPVRQIRREQKVIESHAFVLLPPFKLVIPECPDRPGRIQLPQGISPALSQQPRKGLPALSGWINALLSNDRVG